jgi:hypothetical protein
MSWDVAMWFGAGFGLTLLIALAWDLMDYEREKRRSEKRLRTDWARYFEKRK